MHTSCLTLTSTQSEVYDAMSSGLEHSKEPDPWTGLNSIERRRVCAVAGLTFSPIWTGSIPPLIDHCCSFRSDNFVCLSVKKKLKELSLIVCCGLEPDLWPHHPSSDSFIIYSLPPPLCCTLPGTKNARLDDHSWCSFSPSKSMASLRLNVETLQNSVLCFESSAASQTK